MKKSLRTLTVAALLAAANFATATNIENSVLANDSVTTSNSAAIDSMSQRLSEIESHIAQKDKEDYQNEVWSKKKYWKIGMASPKLKRTDGEEMDWKTDYSVFLQRGKTSYLHKKPIAGMIKIGIDWGYLDINYSKLKLKSVKLEADDDNTRASMARANTSEGFDDIVSGDPNGNPLSAMGVNLGMHKIDNSLHVGPSISINPWKKLIATAYFHVRPTFSGIIQNDSFAYGFGCATAAGVSVAYNSLSLGIEGVWSTIKYTQSSFDGDDDEDDYSSSYDDSDDDNKSIFDTEKFKLKQSGIRFYLAFRL